MNYHSKSNNLKSTSCGVYQLALKDIGWAKKLFTSKSLFSQLSYEQLFELLGAHPALRDEMLQQQEWQSLITPAEIKALAQAEDQEFLIHWLSDKRVQAHMTEKDLCAWAQTGDKVALNVLKNDGLMSRCGPKAKAFIAGSSLIAMQYSLLHGIAIQPEHYGVWMRHAPDMAQDLFNTTDDVKARFEIAKYHSELALQWLESTSTQQLNVDHLISIVRHQRVADYLLANKALLTQYSQVDIARLVKAQPALSQIIKMLPVDSLDGAVLVNIAKHKQCAWHFYQLFAGANMVSQKFTSEQLGELAILDERVAQAFLKNALNNASNLPLLCTIAKHQPHVAKALVTREKLLLKLEGKSLVLLAQSSPEVVKKLMKLPPVVAKIQACPQVGVLSRTHLGLLMTMAQEPLWQQGLSKRQLLILKRRHDLCQGLQAYLSQTMEQGSKATSSQAHKALTPLFSQPTGLGATARETKPKRKLTLS